MRKTIFVALMCLLFTGCASEVTDGFDGKIVRDADGNVYILEHTLGDMYFPRSLNKKHE